jgi:hypothetical protein
LEEEMTRTGIGFEERLISAVCAVSPVGNGSLEQPFSSDVNGFGSLLTATVIAAATSTKRNGYLVCNGHFMRVTLKTEGNYFLTDDGVVEFKKDVEEKEIWVPSEDKSTIRIKVGGQEVSFEIEVIVAEIEDIES